MNNKYFECDSKTILNEENDVLRLFEKQYPISKLLVHQSNLSPDFFNLKTGLAGGILQKLANYHVQTAFILDFASIESERFKELIYEANMKNEYRFFETKEEAVEWLLKD